MTDAPTPGIGRPSAATTEIGFGGLARRSAVFAIGSIASKVAGLVLVPLLARRLDPEGFGRLDILSTMVSAIASLAILGLDVAATRRYANESHEGRRRLFGTWLAVTVALALVILAVLASGRDAISSALFGETTDATAVALVGCAVAASLLQVVGLTALRNEGRTAAYAATSSAGIAANFAFVVALVAWRPDVQSVVLGIAGGFVVGAIASLWVARRVVLGRPSRPAAEALFRLGLPLVPALAATWIGEFANRAILLSEAGEAEVGFLSIAIRLGSAAVLVVSGFQLAWHPLAFGRDASPTSRARTATEAGHILLVVGVVVATFGLVSPELVVVLGGTQYEDAVPAAGWVLLQGFGLALYLVAGIPSALSEHMRDLGISSFIGAVAAIALNLAVASTFGAAGTAAALAIGQFVAVGVQVALARRRPPVPIAWGRHLVLTAAITTTALLATVPNGGSVPLAARAGLLVALTLVLAALGAHREVLAGVRLWREAQAAAQTPSDETTSRIDET